MATRLYLYTILLFPKIAAALGLLAFTTLLICSLAIYIVIPIYLQS